MDDDRCPGLSPRVRGNPNTEYRISIVVGSIPACAGEPGVKGQELVGIRVYPRVCGGTAGGVFAAAPAGGLSPRVRGNRLALMPGHDDVGSIPACAGEPGGAAT